MKKELIDLIYSDCQRSCRNAEVLSDLRNKRILMTGGTGFMGKWVAEAVSFLNQTYDFNIQLYLLARDIQAFKEEVPHLATKSFIKLIEHDVRTVAVLPPDVTYVIHAAASPDNREHASQPLKIIDVIYKGTSALLDACLRQSNITKIVHVSSNAIYGKVNEDIQYIKETNLGGLDSNTVNVAYGEAKRMAETLCAIYRNQQKLPIVMIRPFAFIGPYQGLEKPWAVNNFMRDSILGGPVRILGNEKTVRSYLYGSDMAFWLLSALANGKPGATYNLGSSDSITLKELAQKVTANFHNKIDIVTKSSKEDSDNISISVPDISAIQKTLGVKQNIDLDTALKKTIYWYQDKGL